MTVWDNENPATFLTGLRDTSNARKWCREEIERISNLKGSASLMEVGIGGLSERLAMDEYIRSEKSLTWKGVDRTYNFVRNAIRRFPGKFDHGPWLCHDITEGWKEARDWATSDIVYSQHVLEHVPGLNPTLVNMLEIASREVLNIFFLPPHETVEKINWHCYPVYHNTYSREHIRKVCEHHGFTCEFRDFDNSEYLHLQDPAQAPIPPKETVLIATRK